MNFKRINYMAVQWLLPALVGMVIGGAMPFLFSIMFGPTSVLYSFAASIPICFFVGWYGVPPLQRWLLRA